MPIVFVQRPSAEWLDRMGEMQRLLITWGPAILGMIMIACESTPTFSSVNTSSWLRPIVERFLGHIRTEDWEYVHHLGRKTGHFSFYGLLCVLFVRGWLLTLARNLSLSSSGWRLRSWALGLVSTFLVASADELHQTFLPSRTGLFSDVVLDTCGGLCVSGLVLGAGWLIGRSSERSSPASAYLEA